MSFEVFLYLSRKHAGALLGEPYGSPAFLILFIAFIIGFIFFGGLFSLVVSGKPRGLLWCTAGYMLPVFVAFFSYVLLDYFVPRLYFDTSKIDAIVYGATLAIGFFVLLFISPKLSQLGFFRTFLVFILAAGFTFMLMYLTIHGIKAFDQGRDTIEDAATTLQQNIDEVLN